MPAPSRAAAARFHLAPTLRERVLSQFRSRDNLLYVAAALRRELPPGDPALEELPRALDAFAAAQAGALLDTDPLAGRGRGAGGHSFLEELQHLNRAFFFQQLAAARDAARRRPHGGHDLSDGDEPLFYQMFVADSLRPPGLENLNGPGPLWAVHEDQGQGSALLDDYNPSVGYEDSAWRAGQPARTPEAAIAEYYGDDCSAVAGHDACLSGGFDAFSDRLDALAAAERGPAGAASGRGPSTLEASAAVYAGGRAYPATSVSGGGRPFSDPKKLAPYWRRPGGRPEVLAGRWLSADGGGSVDETLGSGSDEFGGERLGQVRRNVDSIRMAQLRAGRW